MRWTYRIHCGSSVTVSPGVTIFLRETRARLEARDAPSMSTSPSESKASLSSSESERAYTGTAAAGGRIVIGILAAVRSADVVGAAVQQRTESLEPQLWC